MARAPSPREEHDASQIARASYFTTCRFLGRGKYDRREFRPADASDAARTAALEAARTDANLPGEKRAMVYAVNPEGDSIHVENTRTVSPKANGVIRIGGCTLRRADQQKASREER